MAPNLRYDWLATMEPAFRRPGAGRLTPWVWAVVAAVVLLNLLGAMLRTDSDAAPVASSVATPRLNPGRAF
jgi:hypothetical protein